VCLHAVLSALACHDSMQSGMSELGGGMLTGKGKRVRSEPLVSPRNNESAAVPLDVKSSTSRPAAAAASIESESASERSLDHDFPALSEIDPSAPIGENLHRFLLAVTPSVSALVRVAC
jgi:hypothetical protein